ncbi:MAG TPA: DUF2809 domain-containing protein [Pirellulales bacterium]
MIERSRLVYASAAALVVGTGLLWRSSLLPLPGFLAKYGGDSLWALAVFVGFGLVFRSASTVRVAIVALGAAWSVEFLQLYHAPWIDGIRATRLGHLALGSSFNSPDLIAYVLGIAVGACEEYIWHYEREKDGSDPC